MACAALTDYAVPPSALDFEEAESVFDSILETDPYRVDNIDIFANILYVQQSRAKLSDLAQRFIRADKDRPEVCSLIGRVVLVFLTRLLR